MRRTTIETAGHRMSEINTNALFVRDGERVGIITGMNLSKAVVLNRMPIQAAVRSDHPFRRDIAGAGRLHLLGADPDDQNQQAPDRHPRRHHLCRDLSRTSVCLGFWPATRSWSPGASTAPTGLPELTVAAREIGEQVRLLRRQGLKVEVIAEIVSDLNRRLFAKLFDLIAPPAIRERRLP